jgi:glucokinase
MTHPRVVIGIDFGGTKTAVALCAPDGSRLAHVVTDSLGEHGAQVSFEHGVQTARALLRKAAPRAGVAAVGVATFGIPFDDRVELAPAIPGWSGLALGAELRAAFPGSRVIMATDTKAAAEAEARWGSLADCDPAVYVNLGTGLAAALVIGGRVLAGSNGAAGEIGYSLRSRRDVGMPGDRRLILEEAVSGAGLQRRASGPGRTITAAEVFAGAAAGEATMAGLLAEFLDELAFHIANITIAVNPARVAVGGGLTRSWDLLQPRIAEALQSGVPYPPELTLAEFPDDAPLLGAVALAVDAAGAGAADRSGCCRPHPGPQPPAGWQQARRGCAGSAATLAGGERL